MITPSDFSEDPRPPAGSVDLVIDVAGYEGPLDVLLALAREQKVDLIHVSILALAEQYLAWITEARRQDLDVAADYLVMAAWLAYLKSRLLIPVQNQDDDPSGEEMAEALQFQLQRLGAIQEAGAQLMTRPRLGEDFHRRGLPESLTGQEKAVFDVGIYDLLRAYADINRRQGAKVMEIEPPDLYSVDQAIKRFRALLGGLVPDWQVLKAFLPDNLQAGLPVRSAVASTFAAALEMVRDGHLQIRQDGLFGDIFLRQSDTASPPRHGDRHD